ncbi:MAG: hypothetical protein KJ592_04610 [Nanoarchaeota archaeon]|nr:hypothetical protein [Nanoarchaeota archaeon]
MAPMINVSNETLKTLNPSVYTIVNTSNDSDFIYIPSINLNVAKQRTYLGKNWSQSHKALQENGERMLTIPEFIEVLKYTKENHKDIYDEITQIKNPWRAEWLDADFKADGSNIRINSNHIYKNKTLTPATSEILDSNTLIKDKTLGISLEDYLQNPTKQGLPSNKTKSGSLYYWAPMRDDNSVAHFVAYSVRAGLDCGVGPSVGDSCLGVRAVSSLRE